jgi:hypothetical protein
LLIPLTDTLCDTRVVKSDKMEVRLTDLDPGTLYAIRVRGANAKGQSEPSELLLASTKASGRIVSVHVQSITPTQLSAL